MVKKSPSIAKFSKGDYVVYPSYGPGKILGIKKEIINVLDQLDEREKEVILLYFGLKGEDSNNLEEIGRKMSLTGERIRQIKNRALQRLRHSTRSHLLKIYLE